MRRVLIGLVAIAFMASLPRATVAAESTVTGTFVEIGCANMPQGDGQAACMLHCAQHGEPIGIKTSDGIYTITGDWMANNADRLAELMAKKVEATGDVDGMRIAVESVRLVE